MQVEAGNPVMELKGKMHIIDAIVRRYAYVKRGKEYEYGYVRLFLPTSLIGKHVKIIVIDADAVVEKSIIR